MPKYGMPSVLIAITNRGSEEFIRKEAQGRYIVIDAVYFQEGIINAIQQHEPDILIMQEMLPGEKSIIETVREIRSSYGTRIIFLVGKDHKPGDELFTSLINMGVYDLLYGEQIILADIMPLIERRKEFKDVKNLATYNIPSENRPNHYIIPSDEELLQKEYEPTVQLTNTEEDEEIFLSPKFPLEKSKDVIPAVIAPPVNLTERKNKLLRDAPPSHSNTPIESSYESMDMDYKGSYQENEKPETQLDIDRTVDTNKKAGLLGKFLKKGSHPEKQKIKEDKNIEEISFMPLDISAQDELSRKKIFSDGSKQNFNTSEDLNTKQPAFLEPEPVSILTQNRKEVIEHEGEKEDMFNRRKSFNKNIPAKKGSTMVSFLGAKRGVGNTTIAFNVAVALCKQGEKVVYIELNRENPVLTYWYELETMDGVVGIDSALDSMKLNLYEAIMSNMLTVKLSGKGLKQTDIGREELGKNELHIMQYSETEISSGEPLNHDIGDIKSLLFYLSKQKNYDYVILDTPYIASNESILDAISYSDRIFTTMTLDLASFGYLYKGMKEREQKGYSYFNKNTFLINYYNSKAKGVNAIVKDFAGLGSEINSTILVPYLYETFITSHSGEILFQATSNKEFKQSIYEIIELM